MIQNCIIDRVKTKINKPREEKKIGFKMESKMAPKVLKRIKERKMI